MRTQPLLLHILSCALATLCLPSTALASTFFVRSLSSASMLHRQRLDTTIRAPRLLNQGLELHAFELLDAPLQAHSSLRFRHDLTTPFSSPLQLDLLYLRWRPAPPLTLGLGRQWVSSSLGFRDIDGVDLSLHIDPHDVLSARLEFFAGRPVFQSSSWLAPTTFDVQGLPLHNDPEERRASDQQLLVGGSITLASSQEKILLQSSYQRRFAPQLSLDAEERAGASLTLSPDARRRARTDANLIYNALLRRTERIELQQRLAFGATPPHLLDDAPPSYLSLSIARRRPWFDASSIFNLFDPSPHDDLAVGVGHRFSPRFAIHSKLWARSYHGDTTFGDWLAASDQDARTFGAHLSQSSSLPFHAGKHDLMLSLDTLASTQHTTPQSSLYPAQWLLDQRIDLALRSPRSPSLFTRHLLLHTNAYTQRTLDRPRQASATSHLLGIDTQQLFRARLSLQLEYRTGTSTLSSFNVYTMLTLAERR